MTPERASEIEQQARDFFLGKEVSLVMLRDLLCEYCQAEKKHKAAEAQETAAGLSATEYQLQRWKKAHEDYHYRLAQVHQALLRYRE